MTKNIGNEDDTSAQICIKACLKFHERAKYLQSSPQPDIIANVTYIENERLLNYYEEKKEILNSQNQWQWFEDHLFHGTDKEIRKVKLAFINYHSLFLSQMLRVYSSTILT